MKIKIYEEKQCGSLLSVGEIVEIQNDGTPSVYGNLHGRYGCGSLCITVEEKLDAMDNHYYFTILEEEEVMNKNNKSEGIFTRQMMENMGIERVIFNDEATIVFLNDGRKGVAVQSTLDEADRVIGLAMAYAFAVGTDGNKSQFKKNIEQLNKHNGFGN